MRFNSQNYPASFKFLGPETKKKAIEIANSLLEEGFEENVIEVVALSNAKLWACYSLKEGSNSNKTVHVHLVPHPDGWALISEDALSVYFIIYSKNEALLKARCLAKNEKLKLYIHSLAGNINDSESFMVNKPILDLDKQLVSVGDCGTPIKPKEVETSSFVFESRREAFKKSQWPGRKDHSGLVIHNHQEGIQQRLSFEI